MYDVTEQHKAEVRQRERFEFGKNWSRFLTTLNDERIELAEKSLKDMLGVHRLDDRTFIDVGSGSGLFSLAARRLGAKVHSFDYDNVSVACTKELRRRYFPEDANWIVQQGSVLDTSYLATLGTYDIVYSWGVLHHTGAMWQALENVKQLVCPGGELFIAIYNELGQITDYWTRVKKLYNSLPRPLAYLVAVAIIAQEEGTAAYKQYRAGRFNEWLTTWKEYKQISTRGMSRWHDWMDWIGGYPYECAPVEAIVDVYSADGFRLTKVVDRSDGTGCNEFLFHREASAGTMIDTPIRSSRLLSRRFGRLVGGPFERAENGWTGVLSDLPPIPSGACLFAFSGKTIIGPASLDGNRVKVTGDSAVPAAAAARSRVHVAACFERSLEPPFEGQEGYLFMKEIREFMHVADSVRAPQGHSPVFLFENEEQLPYPHSIHEHIRTIGAGRFSHWDVGIYFATGDNSNPNTNKRRYRVLVATEGL